MRARGGGRNLPDCSDSSRVGAPDGLAHRETVIRWPPKGANWPRWRIGHPLSAWRVADYDSPARSLRRSVALRILGGIVGRRPTFGGPEWCQASILKTNSFPNRCKRTYRDYASAGLLTAAWRASGLATRRCGPPPTNRTGSGGCPSSTGNWRKSGISIRFRSGSGVVTAMPSCSEWADPAFARRYCAFASGDRTGTRISGWLIRRIRHRSELARNPFGSSPPSSYRQASQVRHSKLRC